MTMQHYRVDPTLGNEIAAFGGQTLGRCFSCGNCTAVCGLSKGDTVFPRKIIRYLQVGLSDRRSRGSATTAAPAPPPARATRSRAS
jgi:heterodisulfide reductase subunit C